MAGNDGGNDRFPVDAFAGLAMTALLGRDDADIRGLSGARERNALAAVCYGIAEAMRSESAARR